jgi:hypothetical protein
MNIENENDIEMMNQNIILLKNKINEAEQIYSKLKEEINNSSNKKVCFDFNDHNERLHC